MSEYQYDSEVEDQPKPARKKRIYKRKPIRERLMGLCEKRDDGCWWWVGTVNPITGYGQFTPDLTTGIKYAHRVSYEEFVGPIPKGLVIDHICNNRVCINPDHLRVVTHSENLRRSPTTRAAQNAAKTTCPQGHPLDGETLAANGNIWRYCKTCKRSRRATERQAARAAKIPPASEVN